MWCNQATRVTWADEMTFESDILDMKVNLFVCQTHV